jgi:hypothetical protein
MDAWYYNNSGRPICISVSCKLPPNTGNWSVSIATALIGSDVNDTNLYNVPNGHSFGGGTTGDNNSLHGTATAIIPDNYQYKVSYVTDSTSAPNYLIVYELS